MKKLAIFASGALAREFYDIAQRRNNISHCWSHIVFVDDYREEGEFYGTQNLHLSTLLKSKNDYEAIIAVGEPQVREKIYEKEIKVNNIKLAVLIDPTALVSPSAQIGEGTIICEFSTIHCNVKFGINCVVQPYCDFGHDIRTGNHCVFGTHFAPGGRSVFGNRVFTGMNSTSKENLVIGDNAILALGAVVFKDVSANNVMMGNPARVTKGNDEGKVFLTTKKE